MAASTALAHHMSHIGSKCRVLVGLNARQVFAPVVKCESDDNKKNRTLGEPHEDDLLQQHRCPVAGNL
jgi:hypothetical protein